MFLSSIQASSYLLPFTFHKKYNHISKFLTTFQFCFQHLTVFKAELTWPLFLNQTPSMRNLRWGVVCSLLGKGIMLLRTGEFTADSVGSVQNCFLIICFILKRCLSVSGYFLDLRLYLNPDGSQIVHHFLKHIVHIFFMTEAHGLCRLPKHTAKCQKKIVLQSFGKRLMKGGVNYFKNIVFNQLLSLANQS